MNNPHKKFEQTLVHLVQELDKEVAANNKEVQKLGDQIYMPEENDKLRDKFDRVKDDDITGERLEVLSAELKDVCAFSF